MASRVVFQSEKIEKFPCRRHPVFSAVDTLLEILRKSPAGSGVRTLYILRKKKRLSDIMSFGKHKVKKREIGVVLHDSKTGNVSVKIPIR